MANRFFTKDNLWNLMFWVMISLGFFLIQAFDKNILNLGMITLALLIANIVLVSYFIRRMQGVKIDPECIFIDRKGEKLDSRYPKSFGLIFVVNIPFSIFMLFATNDLSWAHDSIGAYIGIILSLPTLYFILKNFPISIIFYSQAWNPEILGIEFRRTNSHNWIDEMAKTTSPSYDYLSYNINHKRKY